MKDVVTARNVAIVDIVPASIASRRVAANCDDVLIVEGDRNKEEGWNAAVLIHAAMAVNAKRGRIRNMVTLCLFSWKLY